MTEQGEFTNAGSAPSPANIVYFTGFTFKSAGEIREEQAELIPLIRAKHIKEIDDSRKWHANTIAKYCDARKTNAITDGLTHFTILLADIIDITIGKHAKYCYPTIKFLDNIADVYDEKLMRDIYDHHLADKLIQPYVDTMSGLGFVITRTKHPALPGECYSAVTISW